MKKQPKGITVCKLECILMPQGEIICMGKTIGWFKDFKERLQPVETKTKSKNAEKGSVE